MPIHRHVFQPGRTFRMRGGNVGDDDATIPYGSQDDATIPDDATIAYSPIASPVKQRSLPGSPDSVLTTGTSKTIPDIYHVLIPPEYYLPLNRIQKMKRSMELFEAPKVPLPLSQATSRKRARGEGLRKKLKSLKCCS